MKTEAYFIIILACKIKVIFLDARILLKIYIHLDEQWIDLLVHEQHVQGDWKRLHEMIFIGKSYVIAIIKFIIEQLFADFTINSFKSFFSLVKRNRHIYFKSFALWLRVIKLYSVLYQIDVYCYFFQLNYLKSKICLFTFHYLNL